MLLRTWLSQRAVPRLLDEAAVLTGDGAAAGYAWGVVLGARPTAVGQPSAVLQERLEVAARAYHARLYPRLLVTGDDGRFRVDEIGPMVRTLLGHGVREGDLVVDGGAARTHESLLRAHRQGVVDAVLISQTDHLWRALFLADAIGLAAVGLPARSPPETSPRRRALSSLRESAARVRAVVDVSASGPAAWRAARWPRRRS